VNDFSEITLLIACMLCRVLDTYLQHKKTNFLNIIYFSLPIFYSSLFDLKNKKPKLLFPKSFSHRNTDPENISLQNPKKSITKVESNVEFDSIPNEDSKINPFLERIEKFPELSHKSKIKDNLNINTKKKIERRPSKFFACKIRNIPFILISDSDFTHCKSLRKMIKKMTECDIVTADNSDRTLESIKSLSLSNFSCYSKSLILLDMKTLNQDKDIIDNIRKFESSEKLNQISIALLVQLPDSSIEERNKMLHQDNILPKPVNLNDLYNFLQSKNFELKSNIIHLSD